MKLQALFDLYGGLKEEQMPNSGRDISILSAVFDF